MYTFYATNIHFYTVGIYLNAKNDSIENKIDTQKP